jgi:outer membrane protein
LAQNIAVLNPEKAVFATQAAKQLGQQLSQQLKPQSERLDTIGQELQELRKRSEDDQALMSKEDIKQLDLQISQQAQEFQKLNRYLNSAKLQTEQEFLVQIRPQLNDVLNAYIEANNIFLIVNSNAVIYAQDGIDITDAITASLDQE